MAGQKRAQLDMLPPDLAGKVRELQEYEFTSTEAREKFDELVDRLRQQLDAADLPAHVRAPCSR